MVAAAVQPLLEDSSLACVNLGGRIHTQHELDDPNTIKTVTALNGDALFFSRAAIPTLTRDAFRPGKWLKQVCIIVFRRNALETFASLPESPLEKAESIDMLRFLENGISVRIVPTDYETQAVDTPADLEVASALITKYGNYNEQTY
jgi:3-deoxy-manno-octulosonate cytidylyltransferase (CMP-KDO synthetase)